MLNLYPDLDQFKGFKLQTAGNGEVVKCFSAVPAWYSTDLKRNDHEDNSDGGMDIN